jgi:hypothetical protein
LHPQTDHSKHARGMVKMQMTQEHSAYSAHAEIRFCELRHCTVACVDQIKLPTHE